MILRKDRVHHSGASNLTNQSERRLPRLNIPLNNSRETSFPSLTTKSARMPLSTTSHSTIHKLSSPMEKTEKFYESHGKKHLPKTFVRNPKTTVFDSGDKRANVFMDEELLATEKARIKNRAASLDEQAAKEFDKQNLLKSKDQEHGLAVQETQLVGFSKYSLETLKNNVNLEKVVEAKRLLRRRYANRPNIQKVYSSWNEDAQGEITVENVFSMSKKLGLNLNYDESRVLLASADRNANGVLSLDEFMDLIYNKDDTLNVNLDQLANQLDSNYLIKKEELEKKDDNLLEKLREDARKAREARHMNQITLMLKNRLNDLRVALQEKDPAKTGRMNLNTFKEALKRLRLSEIALSQQDIHDLFKKYSTGSEKLDYDVLVRNLKDFKLEYDHEYRSYVPKQQFSRGNSNNDNQLGGEQGFDNVDIVDCRELPYNMMLNYFARSKKVSYEIQKYFPQKEDLNDYLMNSLKVSKEEAENNVVSKKEFKDVVERLFTKLDISHLGKKDMEGFFSSVLFNKHGMTSMKEIAHTIYDENENQFFNKIQMKKKGPAPQSEHASPRKGDIFETPKKLKTIDEDEGKQDEAEGEDLIKKYSQSEKKVSNKLTPNMFKKKYSTPQLKSLNEGSDYGTVEKLDDKLKGILNEVDYAVFGTTKSAYKAFKEFDLDNDGYLSYKDITDKLQGKHLFKKEDVERLIEYVDPEQNGFVDFPDFARKIRPNMANQDEEGEYRERLGLRFFKPDFEGEVQTMLKTNLAFSDARKEYRGKVQKIPYTERITRDQHTPAWKNTFLNVQPDSNSPMFISEAQRFDHSKFASTKFQLDDKQKTQDIKLKKWENMRERQDMMRTRLEEASMRAEAKEQSHLLSKGMSQRAYEKATKLKNIFA